MESLVWIGWTTIRGSSAAGPVSVTPSDASYLDVSEFDDVVIYLDVKEVTGTVSCSFQTAASKDDASFVTIVPAFNLSATTTGPSVYRVFGNAAPIPAAKWLRWQLSGASTWDATFRLFLAAHRFGD